uniref:Uncharacterized protein n=1 Tax=Timema tahoe TaxID=61484 RepID=A0A7R9P1M2_9NEOP|nr:unnamed protein product [Timema tahoe]
MRYPYLAVHVRLPTRRLFFIDFPASLLFKFKSDCMFCYGAHEMVKAHLQQNHGPLFYYHFSHKGVWGFFESGGRSIPRTGNVKNQTKLLPPVEWAMARSKLTGSFNRHDVLETMLHFRRTK